MGYPAMNPLVDEPQPARAPSEPGPDHLLGVSTPADARVALDAADRLVLLDGRATAWRVAERLALALFALAVMAATGTGDGSLIGSWWLLGLGILPVLLLSVLSSRTAGMTTSLCPRWVDVLAWGVLVGVVFGWSQAEPATGWFGVLIVVAVLGYALVPAVAWGIATRRAGGVQGWSPGSQAFALLSVLDCAGSVAPERLIALAGLTPGNGDRWVERLRSEQSVTGGRRRHRVLGDQHVRLTPPGHERLRRMRGELERVAARAPVG